MMSWQAGPDVLACNDIRHEDFAGCQGACSITKPYAITPC